MTGPPTPEVRWSPFEEGHLEIAVPRSKGPWAIILLTPDQARQLAVDLVAVLETKEGRMLG